MLVPKGALPPQLEAPAEVITAEKSDSESPATASRLKEKVRAQLQQGIDAITDWNDVKISLEVGILVHS